MGGFAMMFARRFREAVRRGRLTCTVRIWTGPHVKAGGRYPMGEGAIVVDSITPIRMADITPDLARESGFDSVKDLLAIARHGRGHKAYLIRFHYLRPGAWNMPPGGAEGDDRTEGRTSTLLQRIRRSTPAGRPDRPEGGHAARRRRRAG
jgi:hypothetical protein